MGRPKIRRKAPRPQRRELELGELEAIIERAKTAPLSVTDYETLKAAMETLAFLTAELQAKRTSIARLRGMLFGVKTEKTNQVLGQKRPPGDPAGGGGGERGAGKKRRGHGRNGAAAYTGADKVKVPHPSLHSGDLCPECEKGKVYPLQEPSVLVRITGMAPLGACVYACDRWRCNLCGEVFTAPAPEGVGDGKYDETAAGMVGLLKYGAGLPFNRIEKLQAGLRIPLPAATQWELVRDAAKLLLPVYEELVRQAAQGEVLYNDDTTMKILDLTREQRQAAAEDEETDERTGVFTSGIVSTCAGHKAALFFTGVRHAGENLEAVLAERVQELPPPIQMCDALPQNTAGEFDTILANCLGHSRRRFVDVVNDFPDEVRYVLETLREVYRTDAEAQRRGMSKEERLLLHQAESKPRMDGLKKWAEEQFAERKVEPNSGLGEAILYMQKHWEKLTLFLKVPGAPLDNNICERALKKAILHRKNALFYKTRNGARVGDLFMSLIHTCELNDANPFDYLVVLQRHAEDAAQHPGNWMPWNYTETLSRLTSGPAPLS